MRNSSKRCRFHGFVSLLCALAIVVSSGTAQAGFWQEVADAAYRALHKPPEPEAMATAYVSNSPERRALVDFFDGLTNQNDEFVAVATKSNGERTYPRIPFASLKGNLRNMNPHFGSFNLSALVTKLANEGSEPYISRPDILKELNWCVEPGARFCLLKGADPIEAEMALFDLANHLKTTSAGQVEIWEVKLQDYFKWFLEHRRSNLGDPSSTQLRKFQNAWNELLHRLAKNNEVASGGHGVRAILAIPDFNRFLGSASSRQLGPLLEHIKSTLYGFAEDTQTPVLLGYDTRIASELRKSPNGQTLLEGFENVTRPGAEVSSFDVKISVPANENEAYRMLTVDGGIYLYRRLHRFVTPRAVKTAIRLAKFKAGSTDLIPRVIQILDRAKLFDSLILPKSIIDLRSAIGTIEDKIESLKEGANLSALFATKQLTKLTAQLSEGQNEFAASTSRFQEARKTFAAITSIKSQLKRASANMRNSLKMDLLGFQQKFSEQIKDSDIATNLTPETITEDGVTQSYAHDNKVPLESIVGGIPSKAKMLPDEETFMEKVQETVTGQPTGLYWIAKTLQAVRDGLPRPNQPLAQFILTGPPGQGKTMFGEALARLVESPSAAEHVGPGMLPSNLIDVSAANFDKAQLSQFIGSERGYVGYGEKVPFIEKLKAVKASGSIPVIRIDEIEKAMSSPSGAPLIHFLLQLLENPGKFTAGSGEEVSFSDCIFVITTNAIRDEVDGPVGQIVERGMIGDENAREALVKSMNQLLIQKFPHIFSPEFLSRFGNNIIPFTTLGDLQRQAIAQVNFQQLKDRLETFHFGLRWTQEALQAVANSATSGRRMNQYFRSTVETLVNKVVGESIQIAKKYPQVLTESRIKLAEDYAKNVASSTQTGRPVRQLIVPGDELEVYIRHVVQPDANGQQHEVNVFDVRPILTDTPQLNPPQPRLQIGVDR